LYTGLRATRSSSEAAPALASARKELTREVAPAGAPPAGAFTRVELSEEEQKSIQLQTEEVRRRRLQLSVLAVGRVEEAETRLATISARVGGRIDRLFVDFTGQDVREGQAIALLYSPEVVASAEEYRLAREHLKQLGSRAEPQAIERARDLVAASRRRLELWGIREEQAREMEEPGVPRVHITIHSPVSGVVTERRVTEGQYVREGDVLYTVSDLSTVWVKAEVYESDLPRVKVGQSVEITAESFPGRKLTGRVGFIEPMLNAQTRTAPVRVEVPNPGMRMRPGMYVNATLLGRGEETLAVPRSAVLDTGLRKVVYVALGAGRFEGRQVELGPPGEQYYAVLAGLKEGERVVTRGNFLIDSQTRITGGMTGLFGGSQEFAREPAAGPEDGWTVAFEVAESPPRGGAANVFLVSLRSSDGNLASDAQVRVELVMPAIPAMGMAEMHSSAELQWDGKQYRGKAEIPTAGSWNVTVEARRDGRLLARYRTRLTAR
ncbi:MAG: efflux RND transporter periplasmic adaptor subunit, partial [Terriglobales bacterium]